MNDNLNYEFAEIISENIERRRSEEWAERATLLMIGSAALLTCIVEICGVI